MSLIVQSYRFSTEYFTAEQAREWLKDHKIKYISFHAASKPHNHLFFSPKNSLSQYIPHTLLDDIYSGKKRNYDFDLFKNISDDLTGAVRKAFGKTKVINALNEISPRDNLYYMMEANTFQFSAEKVKDEVAQVNAAFEKNLPYNEFKNEVDKINDTYNSNYLKTEYGTAYATCLNGATYADRIKDKDLFPYVRWNQIDRETAREEHEVLDGLIWNIDELEAIPPVDQNCYDNKTSIYTKRGWILFENLNAEDFVYTINPLTKQPEWQKPIRYIKKNHSGKMIEIKTTNFSCCVTPDHSMLVRKSWDRHEGRNVLKLIKAKDIADSDCIYKTTEWNKKQLANGIKIGEKVIDIETYCKFMGWWLSEGSVTKRKKNAYQIGIRQCKKDNCDIIREDLKKMPYNVWEVKGQNFGINNKELGEYLMQFGKCNQKFIPDIIKNCSKEMIEIFLDRFIKGDGTVTQPKLLKSGFYCKPVKSIFSSSKRMIDDLSELVLKIGKSCNMTIHQKKGTITKHHNGIYISNYDVWRLTITGSDYFHIKKKQHIKEIDYNDYVYCVEVPEYHTLLVQRDGKIYWSGNCGCSLDYLTADEVDEEDVSDMDDMIDILSNQEATAKGYENYYEQIKDMGFFDNQAKSMKVFDLDAAYNGLPKNFAFADQGIKPVAELESDDYPALNLTEQTDNRLKDEVIQDYSARNIQTPQYEVSQSMKNISPYVKSITSRPDEVYLSGDNKYTYVKFYNDNGRVNALAVNAKVSKAGIKINRWYQIEDSQRLRQQQLIYRKP